VEGLATELAPIAAVWKGSQVFHDWDGIVAWESTAGDRGYDDGYPIPKERQDRARRQVVGLEIRVWRLGRCPGSTLLSSYLGPPNDDRRDPWNGDLSCLDFVRGSGRRRFTNAACC
jgi:hypothetical protein